MQDDVERLGERQLLATGAGDVLRGQIGDLAVHEGHAYVNSGTATCQRGGFFVVDVSDPSNPVQRAFEPALASNAHTDGVAVVGDLLAVNNRNCGGIGTDGGGFDLYDISDPADPVAHGRGFGEDDGSAADVDDTGGLAMWDAGDSVYLAAVDTSTIAGEGLEIWDVTDPASPSLVAEHDVAAYAGVDTESAYSDTPLLRDVTVENVDGTWTLFAATLDAGVVRLDVDDPAAPVLVSDTDFPGTDPLTGFSPPEGNSRHAELTASGDHLVGGDEDVLPFRPRELTIQDTEEDHPVARIAGAGPIALTGEGELNGPTAYGGYGCDASAAIPTPAASGMPAKLPGEEWIVVLQRGPDNDPDDTYAACFPGEKAQNAADAGWDAVVIGNRHEGSQPADRAFCGNGGFAEPIVTVCTTHTALHAIFNDPATYTTPYDDDTELVPLGTPGEKIRVTEDFDGWGYVSLYDAEPDDQDKMPLRDAYAIPEALNPAFAFGFGELSFSKVATDPLEPLAYVAWRSGGLRVLHTDGRLAELGAFIPQDGADFLGVEQLTGGDGRRVIAVSDRDFGVLLLRHTGLGAAEPPACDDVSASVAFGQAVDVPLDCTDANGNPLTLRIASGPSAGSLGAIDEAAGTVTYTNSGNPGGTDSFTFGASDGDAESAPATATVAIGAAPVVPPPAAASPPGAPPGGSPAPPGGSPRDVTPPRITGLRLSRSAFRAAAGTRIGFTLSEAAALTMTVQRASAGRRVGGRCRRATRANRRRPRCTRYATQPGRVAGTGAAGANRLPFARRGLRPGRYRLVLLATDAAGNRSAPARASFRIVRR